MSNFTNYDQSHTTDTSTYDSSTVARQISLLAWLIRMRQHEPTSTDVEDAYKMAHDQEPGEVQDYVVSDNRRAS